MSAHRAISFARRTPTQRSIENKPIDAKVFKREGWANEVERDFRERCEQDLVKPSPCRRLVLLKDSIRQCSQEKAGGEVADSNPTPEDDLGVFLACLKSLGRRNYTRVASLRRSCPRLDTLLPHAPETGNMSQMCKNLRDTSVEMSRDIITEEIQALARSPPSDQEERNRAKENILKKLSRLAPGDSTGISAIKRPQDDQVTTSPEEIAEVLRGHWKGVFSEKQVELTALQTWMEDLFVKDGEGLFITGLPQGGDRIWTIKKKAIRNAINIAKNSAPGPDGIPSSAFKVLGELAVDI